MKAKVSMNSEGMKKFFATHGEKVAFGVLLIAAAWIGYSSLQVPLYGEPAPGSTAPKKNAQALWEAVSQAEANIDNTKRDIAGYLTKDGVAQPKAPFADVIEKLVGNLNPAAFAGIEWNRPLQDTKDRRTEPVYLAARDLRASFHFGAVNFRGDENTRGVRGEEFVCVTALVPFQQQKDEFFNAFKDSKDAKKNSIPIYDIYEIRRVELPPGTPDDVAIDWDNQGKSLNLAEQVDQVMATWDGATKELAVIKYTQWPFLTQPLPPVADPATLGEYVAHVPDIPMFVPDAAGPAAAQPAAAAAPVGGVFGRNPAAPVAAPVVPAPDQNDAAKDVPYYLLRFFDFNIEPGKAYRYQIRLVLKNPNEGLNLAFLEKPELALGATRSAPWSNPSPPASFPFLENYFAGDLEPANGDNEATANVASRIWMPPFGADVFVEHAKRLRGAMLNAPQADLFFRIPGKPQAGTQKTAVKTDAMLLDFSFERRDLQQRTSEGRPISRPSEMLVLSPRGELMIRTQLMNWPQWEEFKGLVAGGVAAPAPAAGGLGPVQPPPKKGPFDLNN